jgi:hypothetical protein
VDVHVILRVHVVEHESAGGEGFELRADLVFQLTAHAWAKKEVDARANEIGRELSAAVDEIRHALGREKRTTVDEYDMQPNM